jgi:hypothetical protein
MTGTVASFLKGVKKSSEIERFRFNRPLLSP